jgi:hypothetical protein
MVISFLKKEKIASCVIHPANTHTVFFPRQEYLRFSFSLSSSSLLTQITIWDIVGSAGVGLSIYPATSPE